MASKATTNDELLASSPPPSPPNAALSSPKEEETEEELPEEVITSIQTNLTSINDKIVTALASCSPPRSESSCSLVAVSKTHPAACIKAAYEAGQRLFGENYVQELVSKSPTLPLDVRIHFIGPLQSNKVGNLIKGCKNLVCVETVASLKLAQKLHVAWGNSRVTTTKPESNNNDIFTPNQLGIFLQIDTSGEETKSGLAYNDVTPIFELIEKIESDLTNLHFQGVMTIGAPGDMTCFAKLKSLADEISDKLGREVDVSMGMSGDFEAAILEGATFVRVGSSIFGKRDYIGSKAST